MENKLTDDEIVKALEVCEKLNFFYGQRAGRELWFDKPFEVQEEDIKNFSNDIAFVKDLINLQRAEIERYEKTVGKLAINKDGVVVGTINGKETEYIQKGVAEVFKNMAVNRAKAEAINEYTEKLKREATGYDLAGDGIIYYIVDVDDIDNIRKEMTEDK